MPSRSSVALHRTVVTAIVLAVFVVVFVQARALFPLGPGFPLSGVQAYSPLVCSVIGGLLALFMAWKIPEREDGRAGALWMAAGAAWVALAVVPSGSPSFVHRAAFSIALSCNIIFFLRFTAVFPKAISVTDLEGLERTGARRSTGARIGQMVRRIQAFTISHPAFLWWAGAFFAGLVYFDSSFIAYEYYLLTYYSAFPLFWVILLLFVPFLLVSSTLGLSFLWTGYRLANQQERKRILWIVLSVLLGGIWLFFLMSLVYLDVLTDLEVVGGIFRSTYPWFLPILCLLLLTGFAVAIFYSGAFDVRPLINKTSVYATLGVLFVILFAVVESLVSEVVEARLGLPGMVGAAASGAIVAAIILPLRGRFSRWVDRWIPKVEPENDGSRG